MTVEEECRKHYQDEIKLIKETRQFLQDYIENMHENNPDWETEKMLWRAEGIIGLYLNIEERCVKDVYGDNDGNTVPDRETD